MTQNNDLKSKIDQAVAFVSAQMKFAPTIGLILGSGLGGLVEQIDGVAIPYRDIPGFPVSTAPSHAGVLHIGKLLGQRIVAMQGRVHMYEGYSARDVAFPVHVMASLGAGTLLVSNASGGLNSDYAAGDIMLIEDHLSLPGLAGADPTRGPHHEELGPRYTSLNGTYDKALLEIAEKAAVALDCRTRRGVYGFVVGPALETPAEVRALRMLGCDAVGMSTAPEVIVARQRGLRVLGISAICNIAVSDVHDPHITSAEEVFDALTSAAPNLHKLVETVLIELSKEQ
ncbi:MAG: purine-nucleoside phosphorylase [Pseudomonadota bacterium]